VKTRPHKSGPAVNIITLGCSKNTVDSENLLTQLIAGGIDVEHESSGDARTVVINTCGFIDRAKAESIETILDYAERKSRGEIDRLLVTGCLSERYKPDLAAEIPEVDGFYGTQDLPDLLKAFAVDYKHELIGERQITTASHFAYLKISEGCDRPCGFCAIPLMRGQHRSRTIESLVAEAQFLVSRGVKEIMLIAQDLTYYGLDLYGSRRLADLLDALAGVEGLRWLRLHYAFPSGFPMEVLEVMNRHANICNYLDMPLQHIADPVLKRMRRGITQQKTIDLVAHIRETVPGVALRTTMLVGYPGETEADFEALLQFIADTRFDRLGVFTYSHEENTYAHQFEDDVPADVKEERQSIIMDLQQRISFELNQTRIGQTYDVLIDRQEGGYFIGRTEYDSPEVDNEVLIPANAQALTIGEFYPIVIEDTMEFDLIGCCARQ
jgi:ribosomal protein S12 methylthiotransferase